MRRSFVGGDTCEGYMEAALVSKESLRPGCMSNTRERRGGRLNDWVDMVRF